MEPINRYLDHAVLQPALTPEEARREMQVGIDFDVRTICVRPCDIPQAVELAAGTTTEVSCVLAFPHGNALPACKADEARRYVDLGVAEIDMVVHYGLIRAGAWEALSEDICAVTGVAGPAGVKVKTIFETAALELPEIARATEVAVAAGADFVKTSTGFGDGGATEDAVRTMLDAAKGRIGVKPSGGIRDLQRAEMFVQMGAARLGVGSTTTPVLCGDSEEASNAAY